MDFPIHEKDVLNRLPGHPDRFHNRVKLDESVLYGLYWSDLGVSKEEILEAIEISPPEAGIVAFQGVFEGGSGPE